MKLRPIIILVLLSLLFSCLKKEVKIPENVIPPEIISQIFRDIHLADALLTQEKLKINTEYTKINGYYKYIYEKYGYTRAIFDSSLVFYTKNPYVLIDIYENVITDLSKISDTLPKKE